MTTSYRRDSDIPRPFGSKNEAIRNARYKNGELIEDDETHINNIMKYKNPKNTKYAAWIVSSLGIFSNGKEPWPAVVWRGGLSFLSVNPRRRI